MFECTMKVSQFHEQSHLTYHVTMIPLKEASNMEIVLSQFYGIKYGLLLFHYYVILPYKDNRTRKIWERIAL